MSQVLTGPWNVVKQLQYVEEATFGTTPATPTWIYAGLITELSDTTEITANRYRALGSADVAFALKCGEAYSFNVKYNPADLKLANYGLKLDTGATGTNGKSLSMVYSIRLNGVENYVVFRGVKTDSVDIDLAPDSMEVTQNFICKSISAPSTTPPGGTLITTPPATVPLCGTDASGFTWNSIAYDPVSLKITVAQNLEARRTVGQQQIQYLTSTNRDIDFDFTVSAFNNVLITDTINMTSRTWSITIGGSTLTFTGAQLVQYQSTLSAGGAETQEQAYTGFARGLAVTP